jgi:hypothetical protein
MSVGDRADHLLEGRFQIIDVCHGVLSCEKSPRDSPTCGTRGVNSRYTLWPRLAQADGQSEPARRIGLLPTVRTTWSTFVRNAGEGG